MILLAFRNSSQTLKKQGKIDVQKKASIFEGIFEKIFQIKSVKTLKITWRVSRRDTSRIWAIWLLFNGMINFFPFAENSSCRKFCLCPSSSTQMSNASSFPRHRAQCIIRRWHRWTRHPPTWKSGNKHVLKGKYEETGLWPPAPAGTTPTQKSESEHI